jgi:hypothetical protein
VSSSHMDAAASLNNDGVARRNGLVQAPPFNSCRLGLVSVVNGRLELRVGGQLAFGVVDMSVPG